MVCKDWRLVLLDLHGMDCEYSCKLVFCYVEMMLFMIYT